VKNTHYEAPHYAIFPALTAFSQSDIKLWRTTSVFTLVAAEHRG
jgi:hypothetical protein